MSIEPFDWFNRFWPFRRSNPFEGFEEMRREMEREFEENLKDIEGKVPKDLVREYVTEDGAKVKEIGPLVYGSTTTIGADGKPIQMVAARTEWYVGLGAFPRDGAAHGRPLPGPLDAHRRDRPRAGDALSPHRHDHRHPPFHGLVDQLRLGH